MSKPRPVDVPPLRGRGRPKVYDDDRKLLGIRVPFALAERIAAAAARRGQSVTTYVVKLLDRHVP